MKCTEKKDKFEYQAPCRWLSPQDPLRGHRPKTLALPRLVYAEQVPSTQSIPHRLTDEEMQRRSMSYKPIITHTDTDTHEVAHHDTKDAQAIERARGPRTEQPHQTGTTHHPLLPNNQHMTLSQTAPHKPTSCHPNTTIVRLETTTHKRKRINVRTRDGSFHAIRTLEPFGLRHRATHINKKEEDE